MKLNYKIKVFLWRAVPETFQNKSLPLVSVLLVPMFPLLSLYSEVKREAEERLSPPPPSILPTEPQL